MSFLTPVLLKTGPVAPLFTASWMFKAPTPTSRDFHIRLVLRTVNISVRVLKQSLVKKVTSKKN